MKILILTQYFPPEPGACAARNSEHAAYWAKAGHRVEVDTAFPNYPSGIIPKNYKGKWLVRESRDDYLIIRSWVYATPNRAMWRRVLASATFMISGFLSGLCCAQRPNIIIASSGPFFVSVLGYLLSIFKRAPFVFEVRDILPQQAIDVGMLKNKFLIRFLIMTEEFLYRRARCVVTVAEASQRSLVQRGVPPEKCFTVENGISANFFIPGSRENIIRETFGWKNKFIAMYIGTHGVSQGLYSLLETAEQLQDYKDIHFVFVGDGAEKPGLIQYAREHNLKNIEFLPLQNKERMPLFYAAADVCFAPLRKGNYFELNIPSKIFEIMACARPIILGAGGQSRKIIEESGGGLAVTPESSSEYAQALLRLYQDPVLAHSLSEKGRQYVLNHFTRQQKAMEYLKILQASVRK